MEVAPPSSHQYHGLPGRSSHLLLQLVEYTPCRHPRRLEEVRVRDPQGGTHEEGDGGLIELEDLLKNYANVAQDEDRDHAGLGVVMQPLQPERDTFFWLVRH